MTGDLLVQRATGSVERERNCFEHELMMGGNSHVEVTRQWESPIEKALSPGDMAEMRQLPRAPSRYQFPQLEVGFSSRPWLSPKKES